MLAWTKMPRVLRTAFVATMSAVEPPDRQRGSGPGDAGQAAPVDIGKIVSCVEGDPIMATLDEKAESRITSEALDLLYSLVFALHEIVYEMAEQFARDRQKLATNAASACRVLIEVEDVRVACQGAIDYIRQLVESRQISASVGPALSVLPAIVYESFSPV
jgi:hypothetical protein